MENILTYLGRLHPLIVHLPIGFLILAIIVDLVSYSKRYRHLASAVPFTLALGFSTAVAACVLGFLLSRTGDYDDAVLQRHQTSGIVLTIFAGVLYLARTTLVRHRVELSRSVFSILGVVVFGLVLYTGHLGGSLTHGSDYLSLHLLTKDNRKAITNPEKALLFEDIVHPILERKCFQCHRQDKRKGRLSLESLEAILTGGKSGPAVVAGDPVNSELVRRILLDPGDEEFMPSDGKTPLTEVETDIIRWWVEGGRATSGIPLSELEGADVILSLVDEFLEVDRSSVTLTEDISFAFPDTVPVERLRSKGVVVRIVDHQPVKLDVTLPSRSGIRMDEIRDDLNRLAGSIIWINLSDNNFTEDELDILASLSGVQRIRLEKNPISDGIAHHLAALKSLEVVNLNQTKLTCAGLSALRKNEAIKRIYTWKTLCDVRN